jgi:ABC-type polysaccharide/polyol phosphate transport system ATPase subunit
MSACIRADNLTLDVPIFLQRERSGSGWKHLFLGAAFDPPSRRLTRLLEDVSFEVGEGDRLAILGRNGAGKSTLLRVLNRVYQPSSGRLHVSGSCQALLNMGLGFNNEATVRENIYLRGVAMGLKSGFLATQVDPILEFAGLRDKANHLLRTLSSGQRMRLGFAISTSVQHDIMLLDEWMGTGDAEFMERAKERMQNRVGGSKIVVLASHSIGMLRDLCNKGIVLEQGRLVHAGEISSALEVYHQLMADLREKQRGDAPHRTQPEASIYGRIDKVTVLGDTFVLEGWWADTNGGLPDTLSVQLRGRRHHAEKVSLVRRPDVMRHFSLTQDNHGFTARFRVADVVNAGDLVGMRVLAGNRAGHADTPLQLGPEVRELLKPTVSR